ncbi:MAG: DNA primase, partial [Bacteroidota bacterium]|nr:DNA primase [Bacteroidota bacterium]
GKSGNAIGFIMEHEKYSYVEALKWIAARYNIEIEETVASPEVKLQQQVADSLFILNAFAQKHLSKNLKETEEGKSIALSYLKHREFRDEIIEKFQLGYNLEEKDDLTRSLIQQQFSIEYAQKSGLVTIRNDQYYDNYRGRIIFPIHSSSGKIIGFGARVIKSNEKAPKYINTPENEIYVKSKILYGTYFARQAINTYDECLLVEGYTDVVSLHQAGIENVVASGGTSLTIDQLRLIRKHTNNLIIIYDGDSAGVKAALRGLDMALEEGLNVKLVLIPDNEDPDSYVKKIGATAFREFVEANKKDFIIFQLEVMLKDAENDTVKKSAVVNQVAETLSKFHRAEDFTKQQDYIRKCSGILKIDETGLTTLVNKLKREKITKEENRQLSIKSSAPIIANTTADTNDTVGLLSNDENQEKNLMRALLEYGLLQWDDERTMADFIFDELEHYVIENPDLDQLLQVYKDLYYKGLQPSTKTLLYNENDTIRKLAVNLSIQQYELSPRWDSKMEGMNINNRDISRQDVIMSLNYFKLRKIKKMFDENQRDIEKAISFEEQMDLIKIHKVLKDEEQKITSQLGTVIFK